MAPWWECADLSCMLLPVWSVVRINSWLWVKSSSSHFGHQWMVVYFVFAGSPACQSKVATTVVSVKLDDARNHQWGYSLILECVYPFRNWWLTTVIGVTTCLIGFRTMAISQQPNCTSKYPTIVGLLSPNHSFLSLALATYQGEKRHAFRKATAAYNQRTEQL